jgi:DNA-binding GntR family transcriptional regulator
VAGDSEIVYKKLREDILAGRFPPGTPVTEVAVAQRFGVSRTPVREALSRLLHDRLLVREARGLYVRAIDAEEVVQIYDLRILLEGEAAAAAARARGTSDLVQLEGLLARDRGLQDPDDVVRIRTNLEFHSAVWKAAHNSVLEDLLQRLTTHLVHAPKSTLSVGNRWTEALDEHEKIIEAIQERDADSARAAAVGHMETARSIRLKLLREMISGPATDASDESEEL